MNLGIMFKTYVITECTNRRASEGIPIGSFSACSTDAWKKHALQKHSEQRGRGIRKRYSGTFHKDNVHMQELNDLYSSPNIVRVINSRRMI